MPDSLQALEVGPDRPQAAPSAEAEVAEGAPEEKDRVPYEIDARRFVLEGTRYFRATGSVVVTRDSLRAEADSLEYDQDEGTLFLSEQATVTTAQTDLAASSILMIIPEDEVREARATGDAVMEGEDLLLLAPIVNLFFTTGQVDRLVAVRDLVADSVYAGLDEAGRERERLDRGVPPLAARDLGFDQFPRRPYARAEDFILRGDSLDVLAPGEVLQEVRAVGGARGESAGRDSLNVSGTPALIASDWLEGDTIIALFQEPADSGSAEDVAETPTEDPDPELGRAAASADTAETGYQLERLVAKGRARSMYRMAPSDSTVAQEPGRFAVHYVVGDEITILLNEEGEAERMEVVGQTRGIHLEPAAGGLPGDTLVVRPDTTVIRPDTTVIRPDTTVIRPDTTGTWPDTMGTWPDTTGTWPAKTVIRPATMVVPGCPWLEAAGGGGR